jgi:hypothetical protein
MRRVLILISLILLPVIGIRSQDEGDSTKRMGVAVVPIIDYDPTFSVNLGVVAQAFYKLSPADTISPSSSTGVLGMYTFNGTYFLGAFQKFHIAEDRWRILLAGGFGSVNFQYWQELPIVGGSFIGFNTEATFAAARAERKIFDHLYAGVSAVYASTQTAYELPDWVPDSLRSEEVNMHNFGYQLTYDRRDHQYNPYRGYHLIFKHSIFPEWLNGGSTFHSFAITYNHYYPIRSERHILATRFSANISAGEVPFTGQHVVGQDDIRGYTSGKYRDNQVYALQAEYRWNFYRRFGAVGFFGLATATEKLGSILDNELLPGGGIGFRYLMLPDERINIGLDLAFGKEDWGLYFRIGEAFGR